MLHESLKVKLDNLIVGTNTSKTSISSWSEQDQGNDQNGGLGTPEGILYVMPLEEYAERCEAAFEKYDFSEVVEKVSTTYVMEVHLCCAYSGSQSEHSTSLSLADTEQRGNSHPTTNFEKICGSGSC